MLSIKRIGGGSAGLNAPAAALYYEGEVRRSLAERTAEPQEGAAARADPSTATDEYMLADPGAPLARWWSASGRLAPDRAPVLPGQLRGMLDGRGLDGAPLVQAAARNARVGGWDLTFSAPKAVGVLYATADPATRHALMEDMAASAAAGLRALHERGVWETRRGAGSKVRERARDVAAAMFPQATSRAGDPQPHVHAVVANAAIRPDGSTGALDPQKLYPWETYAGAVFRAELADRLARRGVAIAEDGQAFTVAGVPPELVRVWSKRRTVILDALDTVGAQIEGGSERERAAATDPGARQGPLRDAGGEAEEPRGKRLRELKERITQATRRAKDAVPSDGRLEARWLKEMEALGLSPEAVREAVREAAARHRRPERDAGEAALEEALERSSVVTERTLRRMVAEAAQSRGGGADGAHAGFEALVASGRLVELEPTARRERVFSTAETLERERRMLLDALERRGERVGIGPEAAERAIAAANARLAKDGRGASLSAEQERAVRHAARGDGVVVVEGVAGAGKSVALGAIAEAARASGARVVGLAPSWAAADVVRTDAALPGARALQGFVRDLEAGRVRFGTAPPGAGPIRV